MGAVCCLAQVVSAEGDGGVEAVEWVEKASMGFQVAALVSSIFYVILAMNVAIARNVGYTRTPLHHRISFLRAAR